MKYSLVIALLLSVISVQDVQAIQLISMPKNKHQHPHQLSQSKSKSKGKADPAESAEDSAAKDAIAEEK